MWGSGRRARLGAVRDAGGGAAGERGFALQPLSHQCAVHADPTGAADRSQPPLGGGGDHHRVRDLGAGVHVAAAQQQGAADRDAEAQRLLDGAVRRHEVPHFRNAPMVGPFDMWPTSSGFEYFYGFIGFEADQWHPTLTENTTPVEPPGGRRRAIT